AAVVAEEAAEPVEAAAHDFDAHFDEAMADVDMDFEAPAASAFEPAAPQAFATVAADRDEDVAAEFQAQEPQMVSAADPFEEAFSLGHEDVSVEAAAVEPAAPVAAKEERSLEDELNALLGNMGARISKPASAASPFSWASSAQTS